MRQVRKQRRRLGMAWPLCLLILTSCASMRPAIQTTATGADCGVWKALSYSAKLDSAITVEQIIAQNARRAAVCGN